MYDVLGAKINTVLISLMCRGRGGMLRHQHRYGSCVTDYTTTTAWIHEHIQNGPKRQHATVLPAGLKNEYLTPNATSTSLMPSKQSMYLGWTS